MTPYISYRDYINLWPLAKAVEIKARELYEPGRGFEHFDEFLKQTEFIETGPIGLSVSEPESPISVKKMKENNNIGNDADLGMGYFYSAQNTHHHQPTTSNTNDASGILKGKPSSQKASAGYKVTSDKTKVKVKIWDRQIQEFCRQIGLEPTSQADQISLECKLVDLLQEQVDDLNRHYDSQLRLEMIDDVGTPDRSRLECQVTDYLLLVQERVHYYNGFLTSFQLKLIEEPPTDINMSKFQV